MTNPNQLIDQSAEKLLAAVQGEPAPVVAAACFRLAWFAADMAPDLRPLVVAALRETLAAMTEPSPADTKAH